MNDLWTLTHGENFISYQQFRNIAESVEKYYYFSKHRFWMWKLFQFGFTYGVHAERKRRKKSIEQSTVAPMCIQLSEKSLV